MNSRQSSDTIPVSAHRLFLFATAFTWPLLFVGGLVTTYGVGMAVPDWPTTFGVNMFLYDFVNAAWGVFIEHGHRLYGSAVGLCLLIVAPLVQFSSRVPTRFKIAAWLALAGVIVQGVMGGLRVTRISTQLAMVHGCFGQLFFAYLAVLTAWSGPTWARLGKTASESESNSEPIVSRSLMRTSLACFVLVYAQVIAGAWLRHFQSPDKLYVHGILGVVVVVAVTILSRRVKSERISEDRGVRRIRAVMTGLVHSQWLMGLLSWWMMRPFDGFPRPVSDGVALIRTAHQANGALVLAATGVMTLWVFRSAMYAARRSVAAVQARELEVACPS